MNSDNVHKTNKFDKAIKNRIALVNNTDTLPETNVENNENNINNELENELPHDTDNNINEPIVIDVENLTFEQLQQNIINELKDILNYEQIKAYGNKSRVKRKTRFADKYTLAMISIRPKILEYIENIVDNSLYTKAQVIDMLLINGIKTTRFDV
jgi:hypothetical protein